MCVKDYIKFFKGFNLKKTKRVPHKIERNLPGMTIQTTLLPLVIRVFICYQIHYVKLRIRQNADRLRNPPFLYFVTAMDGEHCCFGITFGFMLFVKLLSLQSSAYVIPALPFVWQMCHPRQTPNLL